MGTDGTGAGHGAEHTGRGSLLLTPPARQRAKARAEQHGRELPQATGTGHTAGASERARSEALSLPATGRDRAGTGERTALVPQAAAVNSEGRGLGVRTRRLLMGARQGPETHGLGPGPPYLPALSVLVAAGSSASAGTAARLS